MTFEFDSAAPANVAGFDFLYVGATVGHLRARVLEHLTGNTQGSSLRQTVGALLTLELSLEPTTVRNRTYFHFGHGERRLTDWMLAYTQVAFLACEDPFGIERELLKTVPLPFNITERKRHGFSRYLMSLRAYFAGRPSAAARFIDLAAAGFPPAMLPEAL